jgi:type I restriction enzyme S subunit
MSVSQTLGVVRRSELTDDPPRAESLVDYQVCRPGDIVFNKMSIRDGAMGVAREGGLVTYHYEVMRPRPGADPRYVVYLMKSEWFTGELIQRERGIGAGGTSGVRTTEVPFSVLRTIDAPIPESTAQRAIADYLDAETARIDRLSDDLAALAERLLEKRSATTVAGIAGRMLECERRTSSLPWLSDVPAHWPELKLTLIARLGSGHTPSRQQDEWWTDCKIPWITTGEVWQLRDDRTEYLNETREMISELGLANSAAELCPAGTVVLSRTASAGFSAVMGRTMATSQDFMTWQCGPRLRPRYLLLCLRAMRTDLLDRLAMGSTHQTIYVPDIQSIRVPVPPIEEQDSIVEWVWARLRHIDAAVDAINRQVELLNERREALITAAVTGQIEIPAVAA